MPSSPEAAAAKNVPIFSLATLPATSRQRWWSFSIILAIGIACATTAPFGLIRWPEAIGFIPAVQGTIFVTDLMTAIWLFAQVSLTRSRALLVLANAYLFTALIIVAHTLTFPGAFSPQGLLGAGPQTTGWLYIIWHFLFPAAVIVYVLLKDGRDRTLVSTRFAIYASMVGVTVVVCGIVWGLVAGDKFVPVIFLNQITYSPLVLYANGFNVVISAIVFVCLASRKTSMLDELLTISVGAILAEMVIVTFFSGGRYDIGWYAVRFLQVVASGAVFVALFVEFTQLYSKISLALVAVTGERDNKLLGAQTSMAALAHEIRQPLSAILLNAEAGIAFLQQTPPDLNEVRDSLELTVKEVRHLDETIAAIRKVFRAADQPEQPIDLNEIILGVLRGERHELARRRVEVRQELVPGLPLVRGHKTQIEEVVLNLVTNAADAMAAIRSRNRVLTVKTHFSGRDAVAVEIGDTGPGIDPKRLNEVFDPFVTTKSEGLGLGLAISRRIIEQHGGELTASSDGQSGATFRFVLPLMRLVDRAQKTPAIPVA